jgi:hypothetical protein
MPAKDDKGIPCKTEDSLFLLLVRGFDDRASLPEEYQDPDYAPEPDVDTPFVEQTPQTDAQTLVSDYKVEGTSTRGGSRLPPSRSQFTYMTYRHSPSRLSHVPNNHSYSLSRIFFICALPLRYRCFPLG